MEHRTTVEKRDAGQVDSAAGTPRQSSRLPIDRQRAEFLRSCRARIKPSDLGLPEPQRRRTEGLRREDVAALSGVSVAWYTWLEQGRQMRVSDEVLERICHTFRLSEDERVYLFTLVQQRPPRLQHDHLQEPPPEIVRMIESASCPAVMLNLRWDVLVWNRLNSVLLRDYSTLAAGQRNLLEILFTGPARDADPQDFDTTAARLLAKLRVDYSKSGKDPQFESLIRRLESLSPVFLRMWRAPEINVGSYGVHRVKHPEFGPLSFENTAYVPDGHPTIRVVMFTPLDAVTRATVRRVRERLAESPDDAAN
jgi:transcriptional regulator with XRE-family HTH domain